jgi:hypothetical protein
MTAYHHNISASSLYAANHRILYAGDKYDYTFIAQACGVAINLAGATVWFTVKGDVEDPDHAAIIAFTSAVATDLEVVGPATGTFIIHFKPADTVEFPGVWPYDIKALLASGEITHIARGTIEFAMPVTRRYS